MENKTFRVIDKILWTDWDSIIVNDREIWRKVSETIGCVEAANVG
jgi:hypothetical protein